MTAIAKIESFFSNIGEKKKNSFLAGMLVYTFLLIIGVCLFWLPEIIERGNFASGDGVGLYYPAFVALRRNFISFFDSVAAGKPTLQMLDFNHMFGSDVLSGGIECMYYPLLPYYAISAFIDEEYLPFFFSTMLPVLWYLSGLSFMYMCRHFKKNMLLSGFFAFFYIFCGNAVYTEMWNPHFYTMNVAFPLLIVGIDRIIAGKRALVFILAIAWMAPAGYPFLIYTLPFVALFALIRIWYVKREKYVLNVLKYLVIGLAHILLGLLLCAVLFLPEIYQVLQGGRSILNTDIDFLKMFIPECGFVADMFVSTFDMPVGAIGNSGAVVPTLLFTLFTHKAKKEHKAYVVFLFICIALPLIWYGINGFSYVICRWGFIPALMVSFLGLTYLPELLNMDKKGIRQYIVFSVLLVIFYSLGLYNTAMIEIFAFGIIGLFPKLEEKVWNKLCGACRATADLITRVKASRFRTLRLVAYIIIAAGLIVLLTLDYGYGMMKPLPSLYIAVGASIAIILIAYYKPSFKATSAVSLVVLYVVSSAFYYTTWKYNIFVLGSSSEFYKTFTALETRKDMMNRFGNISTAYVYTGKIEEDNGSAEETDLTEEEEALFDEFVEKADENGVITDPDAIRELFGMKNEFAEIEAEMSGESDDTPSKDVFRIYKRFVAQDQFLNLGLRYGLPTTAGIQSTIDKRIVNFLNRCGQDCLSFQSKIQFDAFYNKEVIYSLFGANRLYAFYPVDYEFYGITPFDSEMVRFTRLNLYRNDYALPVGSTYDTLMSEDYFNALSSAELPYAMYNYAYLEGYDGGGMKTADSRVAHECDIELTRNVFLESAFGNKMANNSIKINEDVSGCFLYISFEDVDYKTGMSSQCFNVSIIVDGERYITMQIETQNGTWTRGEGKYTTALGYCEEDVNEIAFLSMFDYNVDKLVVTAIPAENYTEAHKERTAEKLRDVTMGDNRITGHIDVSSDKILSVPMIYSIGWKAYIDGVETKVYMLNDIFLGVPLKAGSHDVVLEYTTPYIIEGLWISVGALIVTIGYIVFFAVKKKKSEKAVVNDENE